MIKSSCKSAGVLCRIVCAIVLLEKRERSVASSGSLVTKRRVGLTPTSSRTIQPHLFPMSFDLNIENGLCEKLGKQTTPEQHARESSSV